MNRPAVAVVLTASLSLAASAAFSARASDKVYEFNAVVECFTAYAGGPTCNLEMSDDDLVNIWGEDVGKHSIIVSLTDDAAEARQVGFDARVAASFKEAHCSYRADVRLKAKKGKLEQDIIGSFPSFRLVEVLSHKALEPVCQSNAHE